MICDPTETLALPALDKVNAPLSDTAPSQMLKDSRGVERWRETESERERKWETEREKWEREREREKERKSWDGGIENLLEKQKISYKESESERERERKEGTRE